MVLTLEEGPVQPLLGDELVRLPPVGLDEVALPVGGEELQQIIPITETGFKSSFKTEF